METIPPPSDVDVLCGRASSVNNHPGNRELCHLILHNINEYERNPRAQERDIATRILESIRGRGGRFLKQHELTGQWFEIDDSAAVDKISLAIRDFRNFRRIKQDREAARAAPSLSFVVGSSQESVGSHAQSPHIGEGSVLQGSSSTSSSTSTTAATAIGKLMARIKTRAELDQAISKCQQIIQRAQSSENVKLLEMAVSAEEQLPLLQQLLKLERYRSLPELQADLCQLRLQLSQLTGIKERLSLARKIKSLDQRCKHEESLLGGTAATGGVEQNSTMAIQNPSDSARELRLRQLHSSMLEARNRTHQSRNALEQIQATASQNRGHEHTTLQTRRNIEGEVFRAIEPGTVAPPQEAGPESSVDGDRQPKRRKVNSNAEVIELLDDDDNGGGGVNDSSHLQLDAFDSAVQELADAGTLGVSSVVSNETLPANGIAVAAAPASHSPDAPDASPSSTNHKCDDRKRPFLF